MDDNIPRATVGYNEDLNAESNDLQSQQERVQGADPWKHRSSGMKCATCIWFVAKNPNPATVFAEDRVTDRVTTKPITLGRCRKHAPSMGGYPVVFLNDWCGDHRLDETKI